MVMGWEGKKFPEGCTVGGGCVPRCRVRYVFQREWSVLKFQVPNKSTAFPLYVHCVFKKRISHDSAPTPYQVLRFLALSTWILVYPLAALAQSQPTPPAPGAPGCGPAPPLMFSIATSAPQHMGFDGLQQIRWAIALQEKGSLSYTPQWSGAEHVTGRFAPVMSSARPLPM
jgi:hypothetical protein